jgi:hypothetical protein
MPAAMPEQFALYNTGVTSGMASGTTYASAVGLSSGVSMPGAGIQAGGNAHMAAAALVAAGLAILVITHLLGFRFGFDVSVGRR